LKGKNIALLVVIVGGIVYFRKPLANMVNKTAQASYVRRAYDTDSQYRMLANNPYFMKYGPYGSYYGSGYDSYLSNWSPK